MATAPSSEKNVFMQHAQGFAFGAVAACCAVTFTNPFEVVKTRLQLQGEFLSAGGTSGAANTAYKGSFDALIKIFRNEGLRGIQRGLGPAYVYQVLLNGTRLGMYEPLRDAFQSGVMNNFPSTRRENGTQPHTASMVFSGGMSGVVGAFIASPIFLVKTRMQSYTSHGTAVGFQHDYVKKGMLRALWIIGQREGLRGLYRGVDVAMVRTGAGSSVQLPGYDLTRRALLRTGWFNEKDGSAKMRLDFSSSLITSVFVCLVMNPFDVATARMYNQRAATDGKGVLYKNGFDCMVKTVQHEGIGALYKGVIPHYLRIGPHTILTFVFLGQVKVVAQKLGWLNE
ncbi:mitochondrial carrier domain-containing protein [Cladochytrium replicatum]|nr:mitochondrial carrier domain-containing protein [Cladochytrium replicatum]